MYYRAKNTKPKNMARALETLQGKCCAKVDDLLIKDCFIEDYKKLLAKRQADYGIKTSQQCAVRCDIITQEVNAALKKKKVKLRLTPDLVSSRILKVAVPIPGCSTTKNQGSQMLISLERVGGPSPKTAIRRNATQSIENFGATVNNIKRN
jgi:hypothetical protein